MIISMLQGGVGNQMFQYAAGLALADKHKTQIKLDINYLLDKSKRYFRYTPRDYALDVFNISAKIATPKEISQFTVPRTGNKYYYHLKKKILSNYNVFTEERILGEEDFFNLPSDCYLIGYWQSVAYFKNIRNLLLKEFTFKEPLPESCQEIFNKIKSSNSVCIVFRRGDYVGHPELDITKLDYYYSALNILEDMGGKFTYFIFSDDITWCIKYFRTNTGSVEFVDQKFTGPKAEYYLQLMIACKNYIIPNSTYPWWAAWLNNDQGKIVIAPKKWFKSQKTPINPIIPDDWIAL